MIKGVLLDLSGVIYVGNQVLPGTLEAIARLRDAGLPVRFLTNTTRTPKNGILRRLRAMGLSIAEDELFTPAEAACNWLAANKRSPHLLIHPDLGEDFQGLTTWDAKAVVIGDAGTGFTFDTLNAAFRSLMGGAEFLALATNRTFRDDDGELSLDAGAFVAALEFATQRKATVLGKPSTDFFSAALASMGCAAGDAVMVGDDAEMDVSGALSAGLADGVLVRTGKYLAGAETSVDPAPSAVVDDLPAAVRWIMERRG
ncbi:MAG: TIGR01458 family HAD-type hydrolase [Hyphomicrobiales bacterium]|nr:TIGR01458 family HAD-type hydrolase [Hyphomicrobiales bacterium]MCP4999988.1 TIGR01458 family HAD-type hydrolase [Hyphomicrobiales bacterium]